MRWGVRRSFSRGAETHLDLVRQEQRPALHDQQAQQLGNNLHLVPLTNEQMCKVAGLDSRAEKLRVLKFRQGNIKNAIVTVGAEAIAVELAKVGSTIIGLGSCLREDNLVDIAIRHNAYVVGTLEKIANEIAASRNRGLAAVEYGLTQRTRNEILMELESLEERELCVETDYSKTLSATFKSGERALSEIDGKISGLESRAKTLGLAKRVIETAESLLHWLTIDPGRVVLALRFFEPELAELSLLETRISNLRKERAATRSRNIENLEAIERGKVRALMELSQRRDSLNQKLDSIIDFTENELHMIETLRQRLGAEMPDLKVSLAEYERLVGRIADVQARVDWIESSLEGKIRDRRIIERTANAGKKPERNVLGMINNEISCLDGQLKSASEKLARFKRQLDRELVVINSSLLRRMEMASGVVADLEAGVNEDMRVLRESELLAAASIGSLQEEIGSAYLEYSLA